MKNIYQAAPDKSPIDTFLRVPDNMSANDRLTGSLIEFNNAAPDLINRLRPKLITMVDQIQMNLMTEDAYAEWVKSLQADEFLLFK